MPEPVRTVTKADLGVRTGIDLQPIVFAPCPRLTLEGEASIHVGGPDRQTQVIAPPLPVHIATASACDRAHKAGRIATIDLVD